MKLALLPKNVAIINKKKSNRKKKKNYASNDAF